MRWLKSRISCRLRESRSRAPDFVSIGPSGMRSVVGSIDTSGIAPRRLISQAWRPTSAHIWPRAAALSMRGLRMSDSATWTSVAPSSRDRYADEALALDAPLFQLPYWNEPLRAMGFRPRYLTLRDDARTLAYATVLEMGPPGARLGLVQRGPVVCPDGGLYTDRAAQSLAAWSRRNGFVFLRFTHPRADVLEAVAGMPHARRVDAFP